MYVINKRKMAYILKIKDCHTYRGSIENLVLRLNACYTKKRQFELLSYAEVSLKKIREILEEKEAEFTTVRQVLINNLITTKEVIDNAKTEEKIYILKLENEKYYVGKTNNLIERLNNHYYGNGSYWTCKYRPVTIIDVIDCKSKFDENNYTKEYMIKYGLNNVRGGAYSNIELTLSQREVLKLEFASLKNSCYNCGSPCHYIGDCEGKKANDNVEIIAPNGNIHMVSYTLLKNMEGLLRDFVFMITHKENDRLHSEGKSLKNITLEKDIRVVTPNGNINRLLFTKLQQLGINPKDKIYGVNGRRITTENGVITIDLFEKIKELGIDPKIKYRL
jgi:predicted GIY-YIG superfamily endonuclease